MMVLNRNQFMLMGLVLLLLGIQLRLIDTFVLNEKSTRFLAQQKAKVEQPKTWTFPASLTAKAPMPVISRKRIQPPGWLGLTLISVGAVLMLHSLAMRRPG
jgi:hypothetical protein